MRGTSRTASAPQAQVLWLPIVVLLLFWLHRDLKAADHLPESRMMWLWISVLAMFVSVGLAQAIDAAIRPGRTVLSGGRSLEMPTIMVPFLGSLLVYLTRFAPHWPWVGAGVMALLACALVRIMAVRVTVPKPVAQPIPPAKAQPLPEHDEQDIQWDLFISYTARDSNEVRRVAESLIRHGYRPWFAEYEIRPEEWDQPEVIARKLAEGVSRSRRFLVFTNDAWAKSEWCNEEMKQILRRVGDMEARGLIASGFEAVAEVRLPPSPEPHASFPFFKDKNIRHFVVQKDILEVWPFLEQELMWLSRRTDEAGILEREALIPRSTPAFLPGGYEFELGGLEEREDVFDPGAQAKGWEFSCYSGEWLGESMKLRVMINPFRNKLGVLTAMPSVSDDRSIHRQLVAYNHKMRTEDTGYAPLGTHLVLMRDGHSGYAASDLTADGKGRSRLTRLYDFPLNHSHSCRKCGQPLVFLHPDEASRTEDVIATCQNVNCAHAEQWSRLEHQAFGEVEFSFVLPTDEGGEAAGRKRLARLSPLMEKVALSIRSRWTQPLVEWQAVLFRLIMLGVMLEGYRYCGIALSATWIKALWLAGAGFACVQLFFSLVLPFERRMLMGRCYGFKMALPLGTWFPRIWNVGKGSIQQSLLVLLAGLWPAGLSAIGVAFFMPTAVLPLAAVAGAAVAIAGMANLTGPISKGPAEGHVQL